MTSITKRSICENVIKKLFREAFKNEYEIKEIIELADGYFNNSYCIEQTNGKKIVLKIAPKIDVKLLRYEKNLMKAEVSALNQISNLHKVPVPKVLFFSDKQEILDSDYVFMEYIEGITLNKVRNILSEKTYSAISEVLGNHMRLIRNIEGEYFGFINIETRRYNHWYDCFIMMISDLMDDAEDEGIILPISKVEAISIVKNHRLVLEKVDKPVLIHKDLWDGNIIVNPETYEITGIIDFERSLYGDMLLEISCGFLDENKVFISQYYGKTSLDDCEKTRVELYKFYLYLLMVIECPYREYSDQSQEIWARSKLDKTIETLQNLVI